MKKIALLLISALALTACLGDDFGASIEGDWTLETGTWDGQPIPTVESHPITVEFVGDEMSGTAACNTYGGRWQINNGFFQIVELAWTEMACMPAEVMDSETAYLTALANVENAEVIDGKLVMTGSRSELTFSSG